MAVQVITTAGGRMVVPAAQGDAATPSPDYVAMRPYWDRVWAYLGGIRELQKKVGSSSPYLPKFPDEAQADYDYRLNNATVTNFFFDTMETLGAKPFTRTVEVRDVPNDHPLRSFAKNVDGQGNSIHRFSQEWYYWGVANAVDWVFVDQPRVPDGLTIQDTLDMNIGPYWTRISALDVLEVRWARLGSKTYPVYFRVRRTVDRRVDALTNKRVEQIWVYTRDVVLDSRGLVVVSLGGVSCTVWERDDAGRWTAGAPFRIGIDEIPVVPFVTGRRIDGSWRFHAPMEPCLTVQNAHFQLENGLQHAGTMTCFPMVAGNGVDPDMEADGTTVKPLRVGPGAALYAPQGEDGRAGEWKFIEPTAQSLNFLAGRLETIENNGRELGRQPLTAKADNITMITTAYAGSKANTLSQAWAMNFRECVHEALRLTLLWLDRPDDNFSVWVDTEFDEDLLGKVDLANLDKMRARGDISRRTYLKEMIRLGQLDEGFDVDAEIAELKKEESELPLKQVSGQQYTPKSSVGEIPTK